MKYARILKKQLIKDSFQGKVSILIGPRQVGKTTLVEEILQHFITENKKIVSFNGDDPEDVQLLNNQGLNNLKSLLDQADIIFIDEGQKIPTIGQTLKLLIDHYKCTKQIFVTGSSTFNLLDSTQEPLTGRKVVYKVFPLSIQEVSKNNLQFTKQFANLLLYGAYPNIVSQTEKNKKILYLKEITSSYLYKDILEFQKIKSPDILHKLLKALSYQIGQPVSYTEISNLLDINKATVENYVDLLEKSQVIFRLSPYYSTKRKELKKLRKIYFYDLGVRNAIINNFDPIDIRPDKGHIFENWSIIERMKKNSYRNNFLDYNFWRSYNGSEVDLIEDTSGKLYGFEFKFSKSTGRKPKKFLEYPGSTFQIINKNNIWNWLTD